jgi:hypothetical protein
MTLTVNLPPATIEKLQAQAAATGKDVDTLVREAVEVKLAIAGLSFREILEPIHRQVAESGVSEDELNTLADEAVAEARAARTASRSQP